MAIKAGGVTDVISIGTALAGASGVRGGTAGRRVGFTDLAVTVVRLIFFPLLFRFFPLRFFFTLFLGTIGLTPKSDLVLCFAGRSISL
jgi:hypothetical protein